MKDLLVYVADADAQAFMRSILCKHQAIGKLAGISALMESDDFREVVETLRRWFPNCGNP